MNKCYLNAIWVWVFLFSAVPAVIAAEEPEEIARMAQVVVVASPIIEGNKLIDSGGQVTVIDKKQIEDLNAQDLPSALRRTPGVSVSRHNQVASFGGAEGGAVYIRGMGSSRPGGEIQILVDGIPKFAGIWSHPLMDMVSTDIAQRIEVYKGAQPVLFGNMSFGAINLVTKRRDEPGFTTALKGAFGSYHTLIEVAEHGGKISNTDYYVLQSYKRSSGHRDNASGELQNYFGRTGHEISGNWSVSLVVNASKNRADDPGPEGRPQERQGTYKLEDVLTIAALSHDYNNIKGDWKIYWNRGRARWLEQFDLANFFYFDTLTDFDNYGLRVRETLTLWSGSSLLTGADFDFTSGKVFIDRELPRPDAEFPRKTFRVVSPYFLLSQKVELAGGWQIVPSGGLRYYEHSDFDAQFTPQAGIALKNSSTELHFFFSRGINYPGLYVVAQSEMFWGDNTGWKQLKPEKVDHFEAGITRYFGEKVRADLTYFYDKGSNRLIIITSPPPPHYENIARFKREGLEATLNFYPVKEVSFFAGGTWVARKSPDNLPYSPKWMVSAGVNIRLFENLKISLDTLYQDDQYVANNRFLDYGTNIVKVDGFWILNGKISWEFDWQSPKMKGEIFLAGENLTDVRYAYKKDYPMPGINGMLGIKL
ncbi:MAG TPA: TonB-dependent receptor, partial [Deltaproteobacteria bacterium]|nr:TonB-dependent receptor [Deltaproteobacteria bacterium]